jgi:general secretion pathway protein C
MPGQQPVAVMPAPGVEPQTAPGAVGVPANMLSVPPPGGAPEGTPTTPENAVPVTDQQPDPGAGGQAAQQQPAQQQPQQQQQQPGYPPPPNEVQMPPPTRSVGSPVGQPPQVQ